MKPAPDIEVLTEDIINPLHFATSIATMLMDQHLVKVKCLVRREMRLGMDSLYQNFCIYPEEMVDVSGICSINITLGCAYVSQNATRIQ